MSRTTNAMEALTIDGACALASSIRNFWLARGRYVSVWIEPIRFKVGESSTLHQVRSNLINGLPRVVAS